MKRLRGSLLLAVLALAPGAAAADKNAEKKAEKKAPPPKEEKLRYTITAPGGLTLGDALLETRQTPQGWQFVLSLDAAVAGYQLSDRYHAAATPQLCSLEFQRDTTHGKRRSQEKTAFDYGKSVMKRETVGGGKSEIPITACARDALTFLFYARNELEQGRVPPVQTVMAGASYQVRFEFGGQQPVQVGQKSEVADQVLVSVKGPSADLSFELFFARDKGRTPLVLRCPFPVGTLSLELVR